MFSKLPESNHTPKLTLAQTYTKLCKSMFTFNKCTTLYLCNLINLVVNAFVLLVCNDYIICYT